MRWFKSARTKEMVHLGVHRPDMGDQWVALCGLGCDGLKVVGWPHGERMCHWCRKDLNWRLYFVGLTVAKNEKADSECE